MVPLDRALVSSYRLSIVTVSLTAAVRPQFATQVFRGGIGRYVNKQVTTFTFRVQATNSMFETSYFGRNLQPKYLGEGSVPLFGGERKGRQ